MAAITRIIMAMKRLTSKKASITEIINGKFVKKEGFESSYALTDLGDLAISQYSNIVSLRFSFNN